MLSFVTNRDDMVSRAVAGVTQGKWISSADLPSAELVYTTSTQLCINFLQFLRDKKKYINISDNSKNSAVLRMTIFLFKLLKKIKNQTEN